MIQPVKKVIRASAGTGKTYRLSLEFIGLLLQYRKVGIHFSEILVITFTKKATAEIRERIFEHMYHILKNDKNGQELRSNIESFFSIRITEDDLAALKEIYIDMLTNKHLVQISTIDSFTNNIFKTIISPYLGMTDYIVQPSIDDDVKDELYRSILQDENTLSVFRSFFERSELRTINDYERFIESVIRHRWAFHLIKSSNAERPFEQTDETTQELLTAFQGAFEEFAHTFQNHLNQDYPEKPARDVLNKDYYNLLSTISPNLTLAEIASVFVKITGDSEYVKKYYDLLLAEKTNIWNGSKVLRKKTDAELKEKLLAQLEKTRILLADYIFADLLLHEESDLFHIIEHVLNKYDDLKFRDKVFTHDDVSYYTFKYLYDPELSLIDGDFVSNSFYEYLSTYTRFVLIDEFQDTSIIQYKILLPIVREVISGAGVKDYGGAIVVGDEKQSIYGWRGGERDLLLNMPAVLHDADELTLDTSYRSDENIITFVNEVFAHPSLHTSLHEQQIEWPYTPINAAKKNGAGYVELFLRNTARGKESSNQIATPEEAVREFLQHTLQSPMYKDNIQSGNVAILARRNADLDIFAAALDELKIPYMLESSNSILEHRAIKPIYFFLQFLIYNEWTDLLSFCRSDIVLIDTPQLKEILLTVRDSERASWDVFGILHSCAHIPEVHKFITVWQSVMHDTDPFSIVQKLIEAYNIPGHFSQESDYKNINRFLTLISDFMANNRDYSHSLKGLLDFCRDEKDSDTFKQVGLDDANAITLMTVHKSKGLEFDTVFLYWQLSGGSGRSSREMRPYLDYDAGYTQVTNYALTFNFDNIIKHSSQRAFVENVERREAIEELNNFYVALTRAKSNLYLCFTYKKSKGFAELLNDKKTEKGIPLLFAEHVLGLFQNKYHYVHYDENRDVGNMGEVAGASKQNASAPADDLSYLKEYLNPDRSTMAIIDEEQVEREEHVDFKTVFLENNVVEIGNVVHYYLSFIKTATEAEKSLARKKTRSFYGTLIPVRDIENILDKVDIFISNHPDIFSRRWTHIYTEFTLFDQNGREQRIDRFMVDEERKIVEIIDYKTGHILEPEQIDTYIDIIQALPLVKKEGYNVTGQFLEIDVK
jgi:ATP-dependent exoDNAse (exonuclease V) beta subunit